MDYEKVGIVYGGKRLNAISTGNQRALIAPARIVNPDLSPTSYIALSIIVTICSTKRLDLYFYDESTASVKVEKKISDKNSEFMKAAYFTDPSQPINVEWCFEKLQEYLVKNDLIYDRERKSDTPQVSIGQAGAFEYDMQMELDFSEVILI